MLWWRHQEGKYTYYCNRGCGRITEINRPKSLDHFTKALCKKLYFHSVEFSSGGGAPLPAKILAGQNQRRNPERYDPLCLSFRCTGQACHRLGGTQRRDHHTPMPVL